MVEKPGMEYPISREVKLITGNGTIIIRVDVCEAPLTLNQGGKLCTVMQALIAARRTR